MKKFYIVFVLVLVSLLQYCSSSKKTASVTPPANVITYAANIQPMIMANCSPCHIPPKGFKEALDTYPAAKSNIDDIIRRISMNPEDKGFMPFKHPRLSDSVINVFVQWKASGLAEK